LPADRSGFQAGAAITEYSIISSMSAGRGGTTSSGRSNRRQQHGSVEAWAFCEIRGFIGSRRLMPTGPLALF